MKIEYLLIKTNDDFFSTADQFKSLLLSNKRIAMSEETITFSKASFTYTLDAEEVNWRKNKEIVFYFTVTTDDSNVKQLEDFDFLIHRINNECGRQFKVNTIWDDISIFYTNKLYPDMIAVENVLRKIIYRFMIKTAGSAWFDSTVPDGVKNAIKTTADKNNLEESPTEDQLYLADFIQLGWFFFEKYTTKPLDQNAVNELKRIIEGEGDKDELLNSYLQTYEARSNWERYFAEKIEVDNLYNKWKDLYGYRNRVAHAKRVNSKDYGNAKALIDELKGAFEKCLEHIDAVEMTEEQAEAVQEMAKETISIPTNTTFDPSRWTVKYPGIFSGASELRAAIARNTDHLNLDALSTGVLQIANQEQKLVDGLGIDSGSLLAGEKIASRFQIAADAGGLLYKASDPSWRIGDTISLASKPVFVAQDYTKDFGLGAIGIDKDYVLKSSSSGIITQSVKKENDERSGTEKYENSDENGNEREETTEDEES